MLPSLIASILTFAPSPAAAADEQQQRAPRIVEFEIDDVPGVTSYRVEVFRRGDDVNSVPAVAVVDVPAPSSRNETAVRLRVNQFGDLPGGEYIITVSAVSDAGPSDRSAPSRPFVIEGSRARVEDTGSASGPELAATCR